MRKELCPFSKGFCVEDCGLYDLAQNQCSIVTIAQNLETLSETVGGGE